MDYGKYKVIIIGAGPAGLSAALNLVRGGIDDILVVEHYKFPRYKCCAGYITNKTKKCYEKLGLDIEDCHYSLIKDFNILYKRKQKLNIENKFLYTNRYIDRVELDNALFELAKSKGIEVAENAVITSHEPDENKISLSDNRVLEYEYIIFADGTVGYGSKYQKKKLKNIAMQLTFPSECPEKIDIHFGITKRGYGWVSSYNGVTNVGLTDVYNPEINYKKVFTEFLSKVCAEADAKELKGAFTPIGTVKPIIGKNIYFAGDAVGACDPLTLSGLRYGLASGERCAEAIIRNKTGIYKRYIRKLKSKFRFMRLMQKVFYLKPVMFTVFNIMCRCFGTIVSYVFNHFFVNKK